MSNFLRVVAMLVSAIALAASASGPSRHRVESTGTVSADFDGAWTATVDLFSRAHWTIRVTEKASGIIESDWFAIDDGEVEKYADCGSAGLASVGRTAGRVSVHITTDNGVTSVAVTTAFQQERSFDGKQFVAGCTSTGRWEPEVRALIERNAKSTPKRQAHEPSPAPVARGFYCSSSPTNTAVGACARQKSDCEATRAAILGAVPDLTPCTLTESAWCVGKRCAPTEALCTAQVKAAGIADDCSEMY